MAVWPLPLEHLAPALAKTLAPPHCPPSPENFATEPRMKPPVGHWNLGHCHPPFPTALPDDRASSRRGLLLSRPGAPTAAADYVANPRRVARACIPKPVVRP